MRLNKRHKDMLITLNESKDPLNAKQLAEKLEASYQVVLRDLQVMTREKLVKRLPAKGHSYVYKFLSWPVQIKPEQQVKTLSVEELYNLHKQLSKPGYVPGAVSSYEVFPYTVSKLVELAAKLAAGEGIANHELIQLKGNFAEFENRVSNYRKLVSGLLATDLLWDTATLGEYGS